jgi:hypothetical protein
VTGRCWAAVQLGTGLRIGNVFLPGGAQDDADFESDLTFRDGVLVSLIDAADPHIVGGDWNADADERKERVAFSAHGPASHLVSVAATSEKRDRFLQWRAPPFQLARSRGYGVAFPQGSTTSRLDVAVDGFIFRRGNCEPLSIEADASILGFTDHCAVSASFRITSETDRVTSSTWSRAITTPPVEGCCRPWRIFCPGGAPRGGGRWTWNRSSRLSPSTATSTDDAERS